MEKQITVCMVSKRNSAIVLGSIFSALNQTLQPVRIIVLDTSGEIKDNEDLCEFFRFHCIECYAYKNITVMEGRLIVSKLVNTEYIWFLDDDYWAHYKCLEILEKTMHDYNVAITGSIKWDLYEPKIYGETNFNLQNTRRIHNIKIPICDGVSCLVSTPFFTEYVNQKVQNPEDIDTGDDLIWTALIADKGGCIGCAESLGCHVPPRKERTIWNDHIIKEPKDIDNFRELLYLKPRLSANHYKWLRRCLINRLQPGYEIKDENCIENVIK